MERAYRTFIKQPKGRGLLWLLSFAYEAVINLRNNLFDNGFFSSTKPKENPYIVSIGNISAGGSGKTPLTIALAKEYSKNTKVAVILRGYRGSLSSNSPQLVKEGDKWLMQPSECGDEAYLLAHKLDNVDVIICKKRLKAAKMAAQRGAKVILMDDGFQHRWLKRDLDIVILDGSLTQDELHVFPNGILREPFSALSRADIILLNKCASKKKRHELESLASKHSKASIHAIEPHVASVYDFNTNKNVSLANQKVAIFCGIANPEHFAKTVSSLGAEIVHTHAVKDHCSYTPNKLQEIVQTAHQANASYIVCTEKDAVKLPGWTSEIPLAVVTIEIVLNDLSSLIAQTASDS